MTSDLESGPTDTKQLQRECDELRARLRQAQEDLSAMREVTDELKDRVTAMNQMNTRLQLQKADLEGQLNSVSPYSTVSEDKMEKLETERDDLLMQCGELKDKVSELRKALEHQTEIARDASEERESVFEELSNLQREHEELVARTNEKQADDSAPVPEPPRNIKTARRR